MMPEWNGEQMDKSENKTKKQGRRRLFFIK